MNQEGAGKKEQGRQAWEEMEREIDAAEKQDIHEATIVLDGAIFDEEDGEDADSLEGGGLTIGQAYLDATAHAERQRKEAEKADATTLDRFLTDKVVVGYKEDTEPAATTFEMESTAKTDAETLDTFLDGAAETYTLADDEVSGTNARAQEALEAAKKAADAA